MDEENSNVIIHPIEICNKLGEIKAVKPRENLIFMKNGKMVISVKIRNFSRSRITKRTSPLESSSEI